MVYSNGNGPAGSRRHCGWEADNLPRLIIVGFEVGAEEEAAPLPCPGAEFVQKSRLKQAVLVVPFLGPRIGKQQVGIQKPGVGGQFPQEVARVAAEKMQIREAGPVAFAGRLVDPFQPEINAHTKLIRVNRGVADQEMAIAAADLEHQSCFRRGQKCGQLGAQCGPASGLNRFEDFPGHGKERLKD